MQLKAFLMLALVFSFTLQLLYLECMKPGTPWTGSLVGLVDSLKAVEKRKTSACDVTEIPVPFSFSPLLSHHAD
jgi:hypothetical protein